MKIIKYILPVLIISMSLFAKDSNYRTMNQVQSQNNVEVEPVHTDNSNTPIYQSREEIDLFVEDFESGATDWSLDSGWQIVDGEYGESATHSINSPNDDTTLDGSWNALSPVWTLPELGDGETMNFSFWLYGDMPDCCGSEYLEDYYSVSLMDIDALAWHASSTDSYDGNSYWCGD